RNSITYGASHDRVEVGTNVVYGAIHHFGGLAGRATGKAGPVRRTRLPARPYLGASEDDLSEITKVLNHHLKGAWRSP
ncbi:MAG: phage virion morphogenesis protein, partial [Burkholderiales bacterium]|nr:phage virion morphogenesis protein [Burkholderiales bacterium]